MVRASRPIYILYNRIHVVQELTYHHENDHHSLGCGPHPQRDTLRPLFCKEPPPRGSLSTDIGFRSLSSDWVQWKPITFNTSRQSLPAAYGRFRASAQRCGRGFFFLTFWSLRSDQDLAC